MPLTKLGDNDLIKIIYNRREERKIEYKDSMSWKNKDTQITTTKCILGMANLLDGGFVVFGVKEHDGNFIPSGMNPDHVKSFTQDKVYDFVKNYADPFVEINFVKFNHDDKEFVIIQVGEFEELPVICKKDCNLNGKEYLRQGAVYIRSRHKPEVTEVPTQTEMREIIELAADKSIRRLIERNGRAGILSLIISAEFSDKDKFDKQLGEVR